MRRMRPLIAFAVVFVAFAVVAGLRHASSGHKDSQSPAVELVTTVASDQVGTGIEEVIAAIDVAHRVQRASRHDAAIAACLRKSRIQPAGITDASAAKMRTLAACLLAHGRIKASEARMLVDVTSS